MSSARSLLTVAATDPTSGAGVTADLQVFRDFGFHGLWVVTALLDQDSRTVHALRPRPAAHVAEELSRVLAVGRPAAVKIGVLGEADVARAVAGVLAKVEVPVVLDPVLATGHGQPLGGAALLEALRTDVLDVADIVTPNVPEAEALTGRTVRTLDDAVEAALELAGVGGVGVLLKGGHLPGAPADVWAEGDQAEVMTNPSGPAYDVHGTGCHVSAAMAALLADGASGLEAARGARRYLRGCLTQLGQLTGEEAGRDFIVHGPATELAARAARCEL